jgi:hypothetical protein
LLEAETPSYLLVFGCEIEHARLIWRENDLHGPENEVLALACLLWQVFNEGTRETVHDSVKSVIFIAVTVEFIAHNDSPVGLKAICTSL